MPHVVGDGGCAADRNILTGSRVGRVVDGLEVGRDHVARGIDAQDPVGVDIRSPQACAAPWVRSGTKFVIPPVPVVLATPVPVRLNQVSIVNCGQIQLGRIAEQDVRPGAPEVEGRDYRPPTRPRRCSSLLVPSLALYVNVSGPL